MVKNGCDQPGQKALKLTYLKWTDGMNWIFAFWSRFKKANSYFNNVWVGADKNRCGHVVYEILKSAVSLEWVMSGADFVHADLWYIKFWLDQNHVLYL